MKIISKIFIVLALTYVSVIATYSQDCNTYLQKASELVSQKKYCDAKVYYQRYSKCDHDADVSTEIALCERFCSKDAFEEVSTSIVESTLAPDVITLKNGEEIQALVQEIGADHVEYKKFDNPNGRNYTLKRSEIFMIRYANGRKDVFADSPVPVATSPPHTMITEQQSVQSNKDEVYFNFWGTLKYRTTKKRVTNIEDLFYDLPEASKTYNSGKIWSAIGDGIMCGGWLIILYDNLYHIDDYNHNSYSCPTFWTGLGIAIVGIPFSAVGGSKKTTAIDMYNASVRRQYTSNVSLNLGITRSGGIGLTINF